MNKEIKVVHLKKEEYDVNIGRPSKWGNPYTHHNYIETKADFIVETREESIELYRKWITEGDGMYLLNQLNELDGKVLGCWCDPKPCHGTVLKELWEVYGSSIAYVFYSQKYFRDTTSKCSETQLQDLRDTFKYIYDNFVMGNRTEYPETITVSYSGSHRVSLLKLGKSSKESRFNVVIELLGIENQGVENAFKIVEVPFEG